MPGKDFFFQAEDGIRDADVTGVQTCALPISTLRTSRNASRANAQARRVGRNNVARDHASGSPPAESPFTSWPSRNAPISVGRNGAEAGMVNTRGRGISLRHAPRMRGIQYTQVWRLIREC